MKQKRREDYTIEFGHIGPVGESKALILRANRSCEKSFWELFPEINLLHRVSVLSTGLSDTSPVDISIL